MLTALLAAILIGQVILPTAPPSTWDGVPGSDVVHTDPVTGEVTYPMGRQPPDALALGCVFGRSNVRCPKPIDREAQSAALADSAESWRTAGASRFGDIEFGEAQEPQPEDENPFDWFAEGSKGDALAMADRMSGDEETLRGFADATAKPIEPARGRLGFVIGAADEKIVGQEPEPEPESRPGCRREEYRYEDGSGGGVRFVCSSGDQRLLDSVMDGLRPSPQ